MGNSPHPSVHFASVMNTIRAAAVRCRESSRGHSPLTPSHHARHRARTLGLTVDIQLALRCPHRAVSVVPLPILDLTESPAFSPLDSLRITGIQILSQDASASVTGSHSPENMRLSPLTPFFLPSNPFGHARDSLPEQLSPRFSVSPVSPMDTPWQEGIQSGHIHAHKRPHEAPMAEMDLGPDCDMTWTPDVYSRPQSHTSKLSPLLINNNHFTLDFTQIASPKHLLRQRWMQYCGPPITVTHSPIHCQ